MIHTGTFLKSARLYAVDLSSLLTNGENKASLDAVWFRRKTIGYGPNRRTITAACTGYLWDIQRPVPTTAAEFLERHDDGRYGANCTGRWDGERYWGHQEPFKAALHMTLLEPMLANAPAAPEGYDGWWKF